MREVIVVGAGASGLMAALFAARAGAKVTVLEQMPKPGRKLLLTGNGKCNLTTLDPDCARRYHSFAPGTELIPASFARMGAEQTLALFRELGLLCTARGECVYPVSFQSGAVLDVLLTALSLYPVTLRYHTRAERIWPDPVSGRWSVAVKGWRYEADRVILCCGSKAAPATGSDGSGYLLAETLGHSVTPVLPALTGLLCDDPLLKLAAGARSQGEVSLEAGGEIYGPEQGEIQWNKEGISGVVTFQLSGHAAQAIFEGIPVTARIDLFPEESEETLLRMLLPLQHRLAGERETAALPASALFRGILNERIGAFLLARSGLTKKTVGALREEELKAVLHQTKALRLPITSVRSFESAQVCRGGVPLTELKTSSFESALFPGLYFAGELLDVDGPCGGYNLQWAWTSGALAGESAGTT